MTKIGIICGSLRTRSLSGAAAKAAAGLVPAGVEAVQLPSFGDLPLYNQDIQDQGMPASVAAYAKAVAQVDAVLFVTPEYNWSIPGGLKNAIDWLSRISPHPLEGKPAAIWSVSPGQLGGARVHEGMRHVLHSQGMVIMAKPEVQIAGAMARLDVETGEITDVETKAFLTDHLARFSGFRGARLQTPRN